MNNVDKSERKGLVSFPGRQKHTISSVFYNLLFSSSLFRGQCSVSLQRAASRSRLLGTLLFGIPLVFLCPRNLVSASLSLGVDSVLQNSSSGGFFESHLLEALLFVYSWYLSLASSWLTDRCLQRCFGLLLLSVGGRALTCPLCTRASKGRYSYYQSSYWVQEKGFVFLLFISTCLLAESTYRLQLTPPCASVWGITPPLAPFNFVSTLEINEEVARASRHHSLNSPGLPFRHLEIQRPER